MTEIESLVGQLLGIESETLSVGQMALRAVIVYFSALLMVRIGEKRFLAKSTAFDVILGIILGSTSNYETEYAHRWKQVANVVFSRTLEQVSAPDRLIRDNVVEEIQRLKAESGKAMVVGGAGLAATLFEFDLIDEVRLAVHPVLLGGGKPMFPSSDHIICRLQLMETRQFKGGVVLLRYQRSESQA